MTTWTRSKWVGGALLAVVLIVAALSILLVATTELSWWVVPSAILIAVGIGYIAYSALYQGNEPLEYYFGPKDSSYALGWGVVLTFVGIIMLNVFVLGGVGFIIVVALLLLVIGAVALIRIMGIRNGGA